MEVIRRFINVKNKTFQITLPEHFNSKRVEVIIFPTDDDTDIPQWHKEIIDKRLIDDKNNPKNVIDCDAFLNELENEAL